MIVDAIPLSTIVASRLPVARPNMNPLLLPCAGRVSRALDVSVLRRVRPDPIAHAEHVDPRLRAGANGRGVDGVEQLRRRTVLDDDDRQRARNSGIDAENSHVSAPDQSWSVQNARDRSATA